MTRKKVKLAFIVNDAARKATFKKRKKGLMKKMDELTTLCGIEACAIVHSPFEAGPATWPSPAGVENVLEQFREMPEMDQSRKMVNQEGFLRQRISKVDEKLKKQCKDNREKEVTHAMFQILAGNQSLQRLTMLDLSDLTWMIDHYLKDVTNRCDTLRSGRVPPPPPVSLPLSLSPSAPAQPLQVAPLAVVPSGEAGPSSVQQEVLPPGPSPPPPQQQQQPQGDHQRPPASAAASSSGVNVENMQRQNWCMDFMSPLPHPLPPPTDQTLGFGGGDEMMMPFGDSSSNPNNAFW
ncbi:hypothetical protein Tsubulata_049397 [Turnera subulata]|uniref:MADS-box domain-containing protein n=1 Tax=Turnera subulata TaxID=218843 RepID=A0A9Q0FC73_9ROSI|nr:hypothetical protein Tsubulata_049397 [Turnera subulata]